jgi:uncharacterized protein YlzI (FlbEa/FlbD family)
MTFKDQIAKDIDDVFANEDEFWDWHTIDGKKMLVQIDNNEMINREKRYQYRRSFNADGVFLKELLIYVKAKDFGALPAVKRVLTFDGKSYIVSDAINEDGIYSISLEANRSN